MNKNVKCVKITPDGSMTEVVNHDEDKDWKANYWYGGVSMGERGELMMFSRQNVKDDSNPINKTASVIYNTLKDDNHDVTVTIRGTVFIFNDYESKEKDFTVKELNKIMYKACIPMVLGTI